MTYTVCKKVIESGAYVKEEMFQKLDLFLLKGRISQEQYKEFTELIQEGN